MSIDGLNKVLDGGTRTLLTILAVFVALWFDPRISYLQRDIASAQSHIDTVDHDGTRRSQYDIAKLNDSIAANTERIHALEQGQKNIDDKLTAILNSVSRK